MNERGKKGIALMLALGFIAGFLVVATPAGAAGGRAPVFAISVKYYQDNVQTYVLDLNVGTKLTMNITVTNTGDNATNCYVNLTYEDNIWGLVDMHSWGPQDINNDIPTILSYDMDGTVEEILNSVNKNARIWVKVSDGTVSTNSSFDLVIEVGNPSITLVRARTTNSLNNSVCVLGIDDVWINTTVLNTGNKKIANGQLFYYLDNGQLLGQMDISGTPAPHAQGTHHFKTNMSGVTVPYGKHNVTVNATCGIVFSENISNDFMVVEPKSDVIMTGMDIDPMTVTIAKGATVPVMITAHLLNNGTISATSATVKFYDGPTEICATKTEAIAAQATLDVEFVWSITDAIALGNHTIAIGVDTEAAPDYWVEENITVTGVVNVSISSLTVSAASEFEGVNVTFTAKLLNNGTLASDLLTVDFLDGTTMIGNKTNVTVAKGQTVDVSFQWMLPLVDLDTNKTIKAKVAGVEGSVALTIKNKVPIIEFSPLVLPAGMRQYDKVVLNITVKNNGSANAVGVVLKITEDRATYCTTAPFNLSVGESETIRATILIMNPGDVNQTFIVTATVGGVSFTTNSTVKVLRHIFAWIGIAAFTVAPSKKENQPKDSTQTFKSTLTIKNTGELAGSVQIMILDGLKILVNTTVSVDASTTKNLTYDLKIKGSGTHKLTAAVGLGNDPINQTKTANCELQYSSPGFETVVLVGAVLVAIVLVRRRKN